MSLFYTNISILVFLRRWNINFSIEQVLFWLKLSEVQYAKTINKPFFYKIDSINVFLILFHSAFIGCPNFDVSMVYSWPRIWITNSDVIEKRYFPFQRVIFSVVIFCDMFNISDGVVWSRWNHHVSLLMLFLSGRYEISCILKTSIILILIVKWYQYFPHNVNKFMQSSKQYLYKMQLHLYLRKYLGMLIVLMECIL